MFGTIFKLSIILVLLLLIGERLFAELANDFAPSSGNVPEPRTRSSTTSPLFGSSDQVKDAIFDDTEKADHVTYIMTIAQDLYVGMGPANRPRQHLQIITIIAHLKAANEKRIVSHPSTAKYEKPADSLIAGHDVGFITLKPNRLITASEAHISKAFLYRALDERKGLTPTLNSEVPLPSLEYVRTPEQLKTGKEAAFTLLKRSMKRQIPVFGLKVVESWTANTIRKFKQSQLYASDSINAKDVEQWVLDVSPPFE